MQRHENATSPNSPVWHPFKFGPCHTWSRYSCSVGFLDSFCPSGRLWIVRSLALACLVIVCLSLYSCLFDRQKGLLFLLLSLLFS